MRRTHLLLALGLTSLASCISYCKSDDRYTCRLDAECDEGAGQVCAGIDFAVDKQCADPSTGDDPFYVNEPDLQTCYFFYCVSKGQRDCADKDCAGDTTCIGFKNPDGNIDIECQDRTAMNSAASCTGFDDPNCCANGRIVRYLEFRRNNPTGSDLGYRCLE